MRVVAASASSIVKIGLPDRIKLTRIFKYFKVPLDSQTLKSTLFDELTLGRIGYEMDCSTRRPSQSGARDEVQEAGQRRAYFKAPDEKVTL